MGVAFYAPKHFRWVCFRVFLRARKYESGARSPQIASKNGFYAKCAPAHFAARIAQFVSAVDKVGIVRATRVHAAELRSICSQCLFTARPKWGRSNSIRGQCAPGGSGFLSKLRTNWALFQQF